MTDVVVPLRGEIDLAATVEVKARFAEVVPLDDGAVLPDRVVVDLAEVTFLDSTGLGAIIALAKRVPVTLRGATGIVARVVEIAGLGEFVTVEP